MSGAAASAHRRQPGALSPRKVGTTKERGRHERPRWPRSRFTIERRRSASTFLIDADGKAAKVCEE